MLTANRINTITTILAGIAAALTAFAGALPVGQTQATIIGIAGLITAGLTTLHFQRGDQKATTLKVTPTPVWLESARQLAAEDDVDAAFRQDGIPDVESDDPEKVPQDEIDSPQQHQLEGAA